MHAVINMLMCLKEPLHPLYVFHMFRVSRWHGIANTHVVLLCVHNAGMANAFLDAHVTDPATPNLLSTTCVYVNANMHHML